MAVDPAGYPRSPPEHTLISNSSRWAELVQVLLQTICSSKETVGVLGGWFPRMAHRGSAVIAVRRRIWRSTKATRCEARHR